MQLLLVGVSHRTAPIELRERLDFSARGVDRALTALSGSGVHHEATIVSTCNRVELYVRMRRLGSGALGHSAVSVGVSRHSRRSARAAPLLEDRAGGRRAPVSRGGRPRLARHGRAADTRAGEGGVRRRLADGVHRTAAEQAVSFGVCHGQARAIGDRARRRRGVGQLCRRRARAKNFRQPQGAHGSRHRRRRDGQAHRHPHAVAGHRAADYHEPDGRACDGARAVDRRKRDAVGRAEHDARRSRHPDHGDRREHADHLARADRADDEGETAEAAVHHRHRRAERRRGRRRRSRAGVPVQHRRPAGGRAGKYFKARHRSVRRGKNHRAGSEQVRRLAQLARRRADDRGAAAAVRIDQAVGTAASRAEDGVAAARGARPRRRDHAADHGEAAHQPDRAAEGRVRRRHRRGVQRRADPAVRARGRRAGRRHADRRAGARTTKKPAQ